MWRAALGLGLALSALVAHAALPEPPATGLAALTPFVAIAALTGGATGGLACLIVLLAALWPEAPAAPGQLWSETFFLGGGAVISGVAGLMEAARRRELETAAQQDDDGLRLAVEAAGIGTFEAETSGNTGRFNASERAIFGFGPDDAITLDAVDALTHEDDRAARRAAIAAAADPDGEGVYQAKYRIRRANDGALRWVSAHGQVFFDNGRIARVVGLNRDITDEVNAESILREKARLAEQLSALAATLPGAIYSYRVRADGSSHMPYAASKIEDVTGFSPETLARDLTELARRVHIDDLMPVYASIARAANAVGNFRTTFRYTHPKKGLIWIECESAPQVFDDGRAVWQGYLQDVTERRNADIALEASEGRLRAVFDGAAEAIFTIDREGRVTSLNAAGQSMFGHALEEIVGAGADVLLPESSGGPGLAFFGDVAPEGEPRAPRFECEMRGLRKDGRVFPMFVSLSEVRFADTHLFVGFARDLTEQRRIEAHVRQISDERLATLEIMAAGLAHEVNQPLSAGATFLTVARRMLDSGPERRESVGQLLDKAAVQLLRAGRIITRVRDFSIRGEPDKTYQSLHEIIRGVARTMSEDEKLARFRLVLQLNAGNDRVIADRTQISQVLVNLLHNAAQAMQTVEANAIVVATDCPEDGEIEVRVVDRGVGVSEEAARTLFEPFHSSKPNGMGVGLSISRAIIEAHFGRINSEPNPVGGAIFSFNLPLVDRGSP